MIFNTLKQVLSLSGLDGGMELQMKTHLAFCFGCTCHFVQWEARKFAWFNQNFQVMLFYLMMSKHSQQSLTCYCYTRLCSKTFIYLIYVPIRFSIWYWGNRSLGRVFSSVFSSKTVDEKWYLKGVDSILCQCCMSFLFCIL